jgi:hypothetical protein
MVIMHATGDLRAAGQTARAAVADAHGSASYAARARAHAVHAEVNADRLWGFDGLCRLHLGNANDASDRLARSVATLDNPRDPVQRGIILTDLALARLRLDDPIACVDGVCCR